MTTWLLNLWDRLRNSLWFIPSLVLLIALLLAIGMLRLDDAVRIENVPSLHWATTTGPSARSTLSTLAGALVTVTSVVFSITMLTLAQTSSMFGSRLLRSFLNHNITQVTLALFLGTSLYCFVVLRSIQDQGDGTLFTPHLSVAVGLIGGLASLAMFIYFIDHVSTSIQAQTIVRAVAADLEDAIERLFPEQHDPADAPDESDDPADVPFNPDDATPVEADRDGYIQAINVERLLEVAASHNAVVQMQQRPGNFISVGTVVAAVCGPVDEGFAKSVNGCLLIGAHRTPRQDVECAVNELVEVAVRALSPGINDPHTAIACIDYLGASLVRLAGRLMPSRLRRDADGKVRLITEPTTFGSVLDAAFDEIRQYAKDSASVTMRLVEALQVVARKTTRPADRDAILRQAAMIERGAEAGLPEKYDRADVQERLRQLRQTLDGDLVDDDTMTPQR